MDIPDSPPEPAKDAEITFSVNGHEVVAKVDPDTPLLYVLRNDIELRGTMFGCGSGQCGACFVLIDGHATPSCDTPLWVADHKEVTTVEGLEQDGELSPVQAAFVTEQAAQCAYCLSGVLVSATALLRANPRPSEGEIREALDRNLCRCGSHPRMVQAVLRAAEDG
ncbi:MAG: (2Fe-2S)-binding protein [Acidimicrobiales bacterium]